MNEEQITKIAVGATIDYLRNERKRRYDKRLYNTRLLLRNYKLLKDHCEKSINNLKELTGSENAIVFLDEVENLDRDLYIEAITKSTTRTYAILRHVQEMLIIYKLYCERNNEMRKHRVLENYYLKGQKIDEIAAQENIDRRTCQRDIKSAVEKLTALIFGIDGLAIVS